MKSVCRLSYAKFAGDRALYCGCALDVHYMGALECALGSEFTGDVHWMCTGDAALETGDVALENECTINGLCTVDIYCGCCIGDVILVNWRGAEDVH